MVTYPVVVPRKLYRGSNPQKRWQAAQYNKIASELEKHINAKIQAQEEDIHIYTYYEIANEMNYDRETVRDILFSVDGGHNGFTAIKPK